MDRWTPQHRAYAVKAFYQNGSSYQLARRAFRNHFNINRNQPVPSACAIKNWVKNFEETASTTRKKTGRPKTVRTPENVERVRVAIDRSPRRSARRHSVTLGISNRTVRRILHQDLHFHPYKIQMVQALKETDFVSRSRFSLEFLDLINEDEDIVNRLWMSDEAHFHLSGYVNKQNFRFWSDVNPRELHQQPLHSKKVTVWCAMSSLGIIGPYFFEDGQGNAVTVTSQRYAEMLDNFFTPQLGQYEVNDEMFFQQDGATSHTARVSMHIVNQLFPNRVISRNGDIAWPSRSPDLTACDFFLWGYLKSKVYQGNPPRTIEALKERIRQEVGQIPLAMLRNVMSHFKVRLEECVRLNGRHLTGVIFKK